MEIKNCKIPSTSHGLTSAVSSSLVAPSGDSSKKSNMKILKLKGDRNVQISENIWKEEVSVIAQVVTDTRMLDEIAPQNTKADAEVGAEGEYVTGVRSISVSTTSSGLMASPVVSNCPSDATICPRDGIYAEASLTAASDSHAGSNASVTAESDARSNIAMDVASADEGQNGCILAYDISTSTGLLCMSKADKDTNEMDVSNGYPHAADRKSMETVGQMEIEFASSSMPLNDINSLQIKSTDDIACTGVKNSSSEMDTVMSTSEVEEVGDVSVSIATYINNHISEDHHFKAVARISYLGWGEHYDAWIDVDSPLLARLNSQSGFRRGEGPVSEEIIFMVSARARAVAVAAKELNLESESASRSGSGAHGNITACRFSTTGTEEDGCFHSTDLADVVNVFGDSQGFETLLALINAAADSRWESAGEEGNSAISAPVSISLPFMLGVITAIGGLHRIFSPQFLLHMGRRMFFKDAAAVLRNMSMKELRETPVETVEAALGAIECLSIAHSYVPPLLSSSTTTSAPLKIAELLYDTAVRYLDCPYLNRRLGGLKMLTDLFKRAQDTAANPSGVFVTRITTFGGEEKVSYRVITLLQHYTVRSLCQQVATSSLLSSIFKGERSHESLMLRSEDILKFMIQEKCFDDFLLTAIWEAGLQQRETVAMTLLTHLLSVMQAPSIAFLLHSIELVEPIAITTHVVDVLSEVAVRCRSLVMAVTPTEALLGVIDLTVEGEHAPNMRTTNIDVNCESASTLDLHNRVLQRLWIWAEDCSGVSDQAAVKCLSMLVSVISLGTSFTIACADRAFPWNVQWTRCKVLVLCALKALRENKSVVPAVRLLQAFICSMPVRADFHGFNPLYIDSAVPFPSPTRAAIAEYLEENHKIIVTIAKTICCLKESLNVAVKSIAGEGTPSSSGHSDIFSDELQAVLNDVMVCGSRVGYKEQLMSSLDFLHQFLRCSDFLILEKDVVQSLWRNVASQAVTTDEVNLMVSFLTRLVLRPSSAAITTLDPVLSELTSATCRVLPSEAPPSCLPCTVTGNAGVHPTLLSMSAIQRRKAVCSVDVVKWAFQELLCEKTFITSPFFTTQAFTCTEKLFRWLNTEAGLIIDAKANTFIIIGPPSSLIGISVFSDIIISSKLDLVASQAAALLTSLPSCLASYLVDAGELASLRKLLLEQCTRQLAQAAQEVVEPRALSRLLMLLSGLLDESYQDLGSKIQPHGSLGQGFEISLYISGANKMKELSGPLVMHSNVPLKGLFQEICKRMDKPISRLKVFRLAKDITLLDPRKTLGQLKFGISGTEQIMVTERAVAAVAVIPSIAPVPSSSDPTVEGGPDELVVDSGGGDRHVVTPDAFAPITSISVTTAAFQSLSATFANDSRRTGSCDSGQDKVKEVNVETLPALMLSSSPEQLNMMFALIEKSESTQVDEIWSLISRLPSSPALVTLWQHLDAPSVKDLLFSVSTSAEGQRGGSGPICVARLLYNLQIIEAFLQPGIICTATSNSSQNQNQNQSQHGDEQQDQHDQELLPAALWGYDYLDSDLVVSWPATFLSKGGVEAVCAVYTWLSTFMATVHSEQSVESRSNKLGISPALVLQCLEVVVRMMRSIILRATAAATSFTGSDGQSDSERKLFLYLMRSLQVMKNTALSAAVVSAAPSSSVSNGPFCGPLPPPAPISTSSSIVSPPMHSWGAVNPVPISAPSKTGDNSGTSLSGSNQAHVAEMSIGIDRDDLEIAQLLSLEWGAAISSAACTTASNNQAVSRAHHLNQCLQCVDMASVQRSSLSLIVSLRAFSKEATFQESAADWSEKSTVRVRKRTFFSVLDGLFAVLSAAAINKPQILLGLQSSSSPSPSSGSSAVSNESPISLQLFLSQFLLGVEGGRGDRSVMGDIVAKWGSEELQMYITFTSVLQNVLQNDYVRLKSSQKISNFVKSSLFNSFLSLRPRLISPESSPSLLPADYASENCLKELFSLAFASLGCPRSGNLYPTFNPVPAKAPQITAAPQLPILLGDMTVSFSPEERMKLSMEIMTELRAASAAYRAEPSSIWLSNTGQLLRVRREFVGSTLRLLYGLVEGYCTIPVKRGEGSLAVLEVLYKEMDIVCFLLRDCLGLASVSSASAYPALCSDDVSRMSAYDLIMTLCLWRPSIVFEVFNKLKAVHQSVPPLSVWDFKPEKDTRSLTGFMGLRNKGCTCYMNSLLQVLYMIPEVREGILSAPITRHSSELSANDDIVLQLQRLFCNLQYGEKKAYSPDAWVHAYKDESGTLPVDVSQQQDAQEFFQVLCERLSTNNGRNLSDSSSSNSSSSGYVGDLLKRSFGGKICYQMLKEVGVGEETEGAISPDHMRNGDSSGKPSNSSSDSSVGNGGGNKNVREKEDPFVCLSLQVKGTKGLEHSLSQFVEGEQISDYQWEDSEPRVTVSKRQCISELSDTLIFHLKRFELNFDYFRREKVNDSFPFPTYLNMLPYTKEGLMTPGSIGLEGSRPSTYYQYELAGVVVHTGTTDSGHYYAYIKDKGEVLDSLSSSNLIPGSKQHSSFPATLSTSSSSKRSISGIDEKEKKTDRRSHRWLEFNDSEVSEFAESRLEAECFGGATKSYDYSVSTIREVDTVNPKSAYMLVYRRISSLPVPSNYSSDSSTSTSNAFSASSASVNSGTNNTDVGIGCSRHTDVGQSEAINVEAKHTDERASILTVVTGIKEENARHTMLIRLVDGLHLECVGNLLSLAMKCPSSSSTKSMPTSISSTLQPQPQVQPQPPLAHSLALTSPPTGSDVPSIVTIETKALKEEGGGEKGGVLPSDLFDDLLALNMDLITHSSFSEIARRIFDSLSTSLSNSLALHSKPIDLNDEKSRDNIEKGSAVPMTLCVGNDDDTDDDTDTDSDESAVLTSLLDEVSPEELHNVHSHSAGMKRVSGVVNPTITADAHYHTTSDNMDIVVSVDAIDKLPIEMCGGQGDRLAKKARLIELIVPEKEKEKEKDFKEEADTRDLLPLTDPDIEQTQTPSSQLIMEALATSVARRVGRRVGFDAVIDLLYCSNSDTRMSFARFLLKAFQLFCAADREGDRGFFVERKEVYEDILNGDLALTSSFSGVEAKSDLRMAIHPAQIQPEPMSNMAASSSDQTESSFEDEEIALAIKLSMEGCVVAIDDGDLDCYDLKNTDGHGNIDTDTDTDADADVTAFLPLMAVAVPILADQEVDYSLSASRDSGAQRDGDVVVEMTYGGIDGDSDQLPIAAATASASSFYQVPPSLSFTVDGSKVQGPLSDMDVVHTARDDDRTQSQEEKHSKDLDENPDLPLAVSFLIELTRDSRMQLIAENWRKSDALTWLLLEVSRLEAPDVCGLQGHRLFLMKRQVVSQLVAVFAGDNSLVKASEVQVARKTAPSSFIVIGPPSTKGGPAPVTTRNIPDWTQLLECVALLVCGCCPEGRLHSQYPPPYSSHFLPPLDCTSALSVTSRSLYSVALKQSRYAAPITSLILHLSRHSVSFSDMISEVLLDTLFQCSAETTCHIFTIMESFLTIEDELVSHRALSMFSGEMSPLNMLKGIQDQVPKKRLVCVCIRSMMVLLQRVPSVRETLTQPVSTLQTWAPWMLKFSFLYMNGCIKERNNAATLKSSLISSNSSSSSSSAGTGDDVTIDPPIVQIEKGEKIIFTFSSLNVVSIVFFYANLSCLSTTS